MIYVTVADKRMRTATNLLLLSLAVVDLLYVIGNILYAATAFLVYPEENEEYIFCKELTISIACSFVITAYTLLSVSIVRYIVIVHPQRAKTLVTQKTVCLLIAIIWIVSIATLTPVQILLPCRYDLPMTKDVKTFTFYYFLFGFAIPLTLIAVFSFLTFRVLRKPSLAANQKSDDNKRRASRMMVIVCAAFAACFILYFVQHLTPVNNYLSSRGMSVYRYISAFLRLGNSCINPIIYSFASRDFRSRFRDALCCCFCMTCVVSRR